MISKLNDHNQISMYIPDYPEGQLPEKDYYHMVVCSLYPDVMNDLIWDAYKKRGVSTQAQNADKIELTQELAEEIKDIIELPSKFY